MRFINFSTAHLIIQQGMRASSLCGSIVFEDPGRYDMSKLQVL